jgi:hypothetical protein
MLITVKLQKTYYTAVKINLIMLQLHKTNHTTVTKCNHTAVTKKKLIVLQSQRNHTAVTKN